MAKCVTILGASARAAAFSAIAAGYEPYAIDLFADRDLAAVCPALRIARYPHDFLSALAAAPGSPWIYTGGLENHPRLIERLAAQRPLWGNRAAALRGVRDPAMLARVAERVGLNFPETVVATGRQVPPADANSRWLLKPRHSSGGLSIRPATASDFLGLRRRSYLQRQVLGTSASALFVAARGQAALLGCSRQWIGRDLGEEQRPYLYAGSSGPLLLPEEQTARLAALGRLLASEFGLIGLFGIDFVLADEGLWILEVNPRYTASVEVLERAMGMQGFALHAAACARGEIPAPPLPRAKCHVGKHIVYARHDSVVSAAFDDLILQWNRPGQPAEIADLPRLGDTIQCGQPVVSVLAIGDSQAAVAAALQDRAAAVAQALGS